MWKIRIFLLKNAGLGVVQYETLLLSDSFLKMTINLENMRPYEAYKSKEIIFVTINYDNLYC